jgi:hypothetical protein
MKKELMNSAAEGFIGSFKLAAMIVLAITGVMSGFVHQGHTTDNQASSKFHG